MKAIFHLFTIFLLAPWTEGKLLKRSLSGYPLAKCNDGTPANYYYTPDLLNADKLVINLQGGGACYDKQGCQNRSVANITITITPKDIHTDARMETTSALSLLARRRS